MDPAWGAEFRARMQSFELKRRPRKGEVSASLKVRVVSGCFHREHSPQAYMIFDKHVATASLRTSDFALVEHESGPELLLYLAIATTGVTLAKSVIDLIVAIIKARAEGVRKGDRPSDPVEVIVRRIGNGDRFVEEKVLRIGHTASVSGAEIEARVNQALKRLGKTSNPKTASTSAHRPRRKR